MAHLERYWHPRYEEFSFENLITFKRAIPNIAHQQVILDRAWVVEVFNEEVVASFEEPPREANVLEALTKNHFIFVKSRRMMKVVGGKEIVKFCFLYSNHTK